MRVALFGAGNNLYKLVENDVFDEYEIVVITDNDNKKWDKKINIKGSMVDIIPPNKILSWQFEQIIITVINTELRLSIAEQLVDLGVMGNRIKYIYNNCVIQQSWLSNGEILYHKNNGIKLFIDVTNIAKNDTQTGIPRTVNSLYKNVRYIGGEITPIQWIGKYITGNVYKSRMENNEYDGAEFIVPFKRGDCVLMPDTAWIQGVKPLKELKQQKIETFVVIYDLIPILETKIWKSEDITDFRDWVNGVLKHADNVLCISKTVAKDVINYYKRNKIERKTPLKIFDFHLGFDIPVIDISVRKTIRDFVNRGKTFLMVGVLGPQKNHLLALNAFKKYYQESPVSDVQLLIIGRDAYDNIPFRDMYYADSVLKNKVLWVDDADDGELQWAYKNCAALLFPTQNEGFGLPLVEAAYFGLPILCSDIPVFHELAGENAEYFKVNDVDALKEAIVLWNLREKHIDSKKIRIYKWKDSAREILDIIEKKEEPYAVLD